MSKYFFIIFIFISISISTTAKTKENNNIFNNLELLEENNLSPVLIKKDTISEDFIPKNNNQINIVLLKKGAIICGIDGKHSRRIIRKMFVRTIEKFPGSRTIYILNKKNKIKYKTYSEHIISIRKDIDLHPKPKKFTTYPPPDTTKLIDKKLILDTSFIAHSEYHNASYLNHILAGNADFATSSRVEFQSVYNWILPLEFGISMSYQSGTWNGKSAIYNWNSTFVGPVLQYRLHSAKKFEIHGQISFQKSLSYELQSANSDQTYSFSNNVIQGMIGFTIPTKFGKFKFGGTYRKLSTSIKSSNSNTTAVADRGGMSSIGAHIGYGFDITL